MPLLIFMLLSKFLSLLKNNRPAITTGHLMAGGYVTVILIIALCVIPGRHSDKHYLARRYMGANTRLSADLLARIIHESETRSGDSLPNVL
jgi:hypothetical protein